MNLKLIDPIFFDASLNLAILYKNSKNYLKSEDCFNNALNIQPNNTLALKSFAELLDQLGRYNESEKLYEKLLKKNYEDINLLINYSGNQIKLGKINNAIAALKILAPSVCTFNEFSLEILNTVCKKLNGRGEPLHILCVFSRVMQAVLGK